MSDPLIGQVLDGRYKIEKVLGEGGMGIVYKAVHTALGKALAIKVLRPEVSKNEEIVMRFRQEAQSASQIGNPHIIDISDFGSLADGSTYFAMEFLTGRSLTAALVEQRFSTERTIHVVRQLANALGAAHEIGIVHRDLKPDNVQLLDRGGQKDFVKVLDFGIAKVGGSTSKLTQAGQVFGTPHYMSPEQCAGTNVDHRTDIYAVGVILYEMVTGRVPFDADNLMGILTKHLYEAPIPPRELAPPADVPAAMEAVILKCLQKKPEQRYESMAALETDLDAIERGLQPKALADRAATRPTGPQTLTGVEARASGWTGPIQIRKTRTPLLIGLSVSGAVMLGAIAFILAGRPPDGSQPSAAAGTLKPSPELASPSAEPAPSATPDKTAERATPDKTQSAPSKPAAPPAGSEPAQAAISMVTVNSTPARAQIYQGGNLLGSAPHDLPRPAAGHDLRLELRLPGYESKTITVSAQSGPSVYATLKKKAEPKPAPSKARAKPRNEAPPEKKPASSGGKPRTQTEVLDPWD